MIPEWLPIASPIGLKAAKNGVIWRILGAKLEPRHAFAIPVLPRRGAVLDSSAIEQNTDAMEQRLPQARDAY
jgi:hypothetical protein